VYLKKKKKKKDFFEVLLVVTGKAPEPFGRVLRCSRAAANFVKELKPLLYREGTIVHRKEG
jgi:hypothetical protein